MKAPARASAFSRVLTTYQFQTLYNHWEGDLYKQETVILTANHPTYEGL